MDKIIAVMGDDRPSDPAEKTVLTAQTVRTALTAQTVRALTSLRLKTAITVLKRNGSHLLLVQTVQTELTVRVHTN